MSGGVVYRAFGPDGELIYIGSSKGDGAARIATHRKSAPWCTPDVRFATTAYPTVGQAREAEARAIADEGPQANVIGTPREADARAEWTRARRARRAAEAAVPARPQPPTPTVDQQRAAAAETGRTLALDDPAVLAEAARLLRGALARRAARLAREQAGHTGPARGGERKARRSRYVHSGVAAQPAPRATGEPEQPLAAPDRAVDRPSAARSGR